MQVFYYVWGSINGNMSSIYRKLVVYFLALNLFAIGAVGIYSYYKEKEALLSRIFDQLISVRQEKKTQIAAFFNQRLKDVENISRLRDVHKLFTKFSVHHKLPLLSQDNITDLTDYLDNAGCYRRLIMLPDKGGAYSLNTGKRPYEFYKLSAATTKALDKFGKSFGHGKISLVKEWQLNPLQKRPALLVGRKVYNNAENISGLLVLEIRPETINSVMFENSPNSGLGKTGEVYLVGNDKLMRSNSKFLKNAIFKTKVNTLGVLQALKGESGTAQYRDYRGVSVLSAYCPLTFSAIHWAILAEIDTKDAMIPIYSIRDNIIYLSLLIALISAAIITFLSRKISEPIKKLKEETTQIAAGEYGNTIAVEARDEIGELTRAFNEMSLKLKTQSDKLEEEKKWRLRSVLDAQEKERQRFSRELHDGLGPLLLTGKMKIESTRHANKETMEKTMEEVMALFSDTMQEIRNISNNMMPSGLKEFGLTVALQNFCGQVEDNYPLKVRLMLDLKREHYGKIVDIYLFRIAQEAINNVLKHAEASQVHLTIEEIGNQLFFTMIDDGKGFNPDNPDLHKGNGLLNMKERVNLLSGFFALSTAPGKGTKIDIEIPIQ